MKIGTILILAGGESSRFWPLSHKSLFKFLGQPLLERQIEFFSPFAERIVIVASNQNKGEIEPLAIKMGAEMAVQSGEGQARAIQSARELLGGEVMVVNSTDVFEADLIERLVTTFSERKSAVFSGRKVEGYFPGGYFVFEGERVADVVEKPGEDNMPSPYLRLVAEIYPEINEFLAIIDSVESDHDDHFEKALSIYLKNNKAISFVPYAGSFAALKYPWHSLSMMNYYLNNLQSYRGQNVEITPSATLEGEIFIEDGVKIMEFAKIVGPTYIGKNVTIGNYSLIVKSMIGEKSVIGGYSEVTRTYLGDNVWLHRNYVGDSVLEGDNLMGAGALIANYRLDRQDVSSMVKGELINTGQAKLGAILGRGVRIGVDTTLMPGVKIGSGKIIMPGQTVKRDET